MGTEFLRKHLDSYFHLTERGTTVGTEVRAGISSFLTLSYVLIVNPQLLAQAGVDYDDAVFSTAISTATACLVIGLGGNLPFGSGPGLGLTAYLVYGLVTAEACTLEEALAACFWSAVLVLIITFTGVSKFLMDIVPQSIWYAVVVGIGLFIAMVGMVTVDLIVADSSTLVQLGDVWGDENIQLFLFGILLVGSLIHHDIKGAILVAVAVLCIIDWALHNSWPTSFFSIPHLPKDYLTSILSIFTSSNVIILLTAIFAFALLTISNITSVLFGLSTLSGLRDADTDAIPGFTWAFVASIVGTAIAAYGGSTPIIICVEAASGVREGGRTGLTSVVMAVFFLLSLVLSPLLGTVPDVATSPVLVLVGVLMMPEVGKIEWPNMAEAVPAFLTITLMPLTYSIINGMVFGLIAAAAFYLTSGQIWK